MEISPGSASPLFWTSLFCEVRRINADKVVAKHESGYRLPHPFPFTGLHKDVFGFFISLPQTGE